MKTVVSRIAFVVFLGLAAGCSTVKPYEKEHLADPIMLTVQEDELRELKWLEAREGSTGGAGGAGGGCACK
jgi:Domain of unknown function (DUF4266)